MIRLIATDMDGTFLNSHKEFDESFFLLFQQMKEKDIKFVIASGNQFYYLYDRFLPISDDIYFISENGAYITKGQEELYSYSLDQQFIDIIVNILEQYPQLMPIVGGKHYSYILSRYKQYEETIKRHYHRYQFVDNYNEIHDQILKFSIHDPKHHIEDYVGYIKKQLPHELKIMTSGTEWMDIQHHRIHKGFGMSYLQDILQIPYEECGAFGDQMNDYELLQSVKYAYAVENAVEGIKDIAYEIVLSNEEQGVIQKINEILRKGE